MTTSGATLARRGLQVQVEGSEGVGTEMNSKHTTVPILTNSSEHHAPPPSLSKLMDPSSGR